MGLNVLIPLLWFVVVSLGLIFVTGFPGTADLDARGTGSSLWQVVLLFSILLIPVFVALFLMNKAVIRKYIATANDDQPAPRGAV